MMKNKVISSGYVSMDRIIKLKNPMKKGFTSLIENKTADEIKYGGCSLNICYELVKLGINAYPLIRVGSDYEKIGLKEFLISSGIGIDTIEIIENEKTSYCYLLQDNNGQHITLFYSGAMDEKFSKPINNNIFSDVSLGIMTVASMKDNKYFFEKIKQNNIPLVFSMKGDLTAFTKDFLNDVLYYSKIIFTNEVERETIEKNLKIDMKNLLLHANCKFLITTLGENGSICFYKDKNMIKSIKMPIYKKCKRIDTTGCGDAFVSGFLYGYLNQKNVKDSLIFATSLASYIIEKEGCITNAPDKSMLTQRYNQIKNDLNGDF